MNNHSILNPDNRTGYISKAGYWHLESRHIDFIIGGDSDIKVKRWPIDVTFEKNPHIIYKRKWVYHSYNNRQLRRVPHNYDIGWGYRVSVNRHGKKGRPVKMDEVVERLRMMNLEFYIPADNFAVVRILGPKP